MRSGASLAVKLRRTGGRGPNLTKYDGVIPPCAAASGAPLVWQIATARADVDGKTDEDAVIAYLQHLGLAMRNAR